MKDKQPKTKFKSTPGVAHLTTWIVCLATLILICSSAAAQNLFMSDGYSGISHTLGNIYKFTPNGASSTFASGLGGPKGLAFDIMGNLYVADVTGGSIYKFNPNGVRSTFATGLDGPGGLAFDIMGNLYVADVTGGGIYKFD